MRSNRSRGGNFFSDAGNSIYNYRYVITLSAAVLSAGAIAWYWWDKNNNNNNAIEKLKDQNQQDTSKLLPSSSRDDDDDDTGIGKRKADLQSHNSQRGTSLHSDGGDEATRVKKTIEDSTSAPATVATSLGKTTENNNSNNNNNNDFSASASASLKATLSDQFHEADAIHADDANNNNIQQQQKSQRQQQESNQRQQENQEDNNDIINNNNDNNNNNDDSTTNVIEHLTTPEQWSKCGDSLLAAHDKGVHGVQFEGDDTVDPETGEQKTYTAFDCFVEALKKEPGDALTWVGAARSAETLLEFNPVTWRSDALRDLAAAAAAVTMRRNNNTSSRNSENQQQQGDDAEADQNQQENANRQDGFTRVDCCLQALRLDPNCCSAWTQLGFLLDEDNNGISATPDRVTVPGQGEYSKLTALIRAVGIVPSPEELRKQQQEEEEEQQNQQQNQQQQNQGENQQAKKLSRREIFNSRQSLAWFYLGGAIPHHETILLPNLNNELVSDIDCYIKAVDLDPRLHQAWSALGLAIEEPIAVAGRTNVNDVDCFVAALNLDLNTYNNWYNLGTCLPRGGHATVQNKMVNEVLCFKFCLELNPTHGLAWYSMGVVLGEKEVIQIENGGVHGALAGEANSGSSDDDEGGDERNLQNNNINGQFVDQDEEEEVDEEENDEDFDFRKGATSSASAAVTEEESSGGGAAAASSSSTTKTRRTRIGRKNNSNNISHQQENDNNNNHRRRTTLKSFSSSNNRSSRSNRKFRGNWFSKADCYVAAIACEAHLPKAYFNLALEYVPGSPIKLLSGERVTAVECLARSVEHDANYKKAWSMLAHVIPEGASVPVGTQLLTKRDCAMRANML